MLYVVLIPAFVWIILSLGAWCMLAQLTLRRFKVRRAATVGWLLVVAIQVIAASVAAIATSLDPIEKFSCLMGIYGLWFSLAVTASGAVVIGVLRRDWPASGDNRKNGFGLVVATWLILSLVAALAHARSVALCTV